MTYTDVKDTEFGAQLRALKAHLGRYSNGIVAAERQPRKTGLAALAASLKEIEAKLLA